MGDRQQNAVLSSRQLLWPRLSPGSIITNNGNSSVGVCYGFGYGYGNSGVGVCYGFGYGLGYGDGNGDGYGYGDGHSDGDGNDYS